MIFIRVESFCIRHFIHRATPKLYTRHNLSCTVLSYPSHPKLWTKKDGRVKFHPKSVNSDENLFANKFMIYHQKMKSSAVFIHDSTMIPPLPLLFFGGEISVQRDDTQETIAVDEWIVFQAPEKIARLVKVC